MTNKRITPRTDEGQTMAEYTLVLGVITFAIVTAISLLSDAINAGYERTLNAIQSAF